MGTGILPAFLDLGSSRETHTDTSKDQTAPAWRYMPLSCQHLPTGLSQIGNIRSIDNVDLAASKEETYFLSTSDLSLDSTTAITDDLLEFASSTETDEEVLSQFYEQSFVIHEKTTSSQIQLQDGDQSDANDSTAAITNTSFLTSTCASDSFASSVSVVPDPTPVLSLGRISDLGKVPNASYLRSIVPQTMTVNLIVGIISISAPCSIRTRRDGRDMRLIEMLVGDETKAGFSINFWLPSLQQDKGRFPSVAQLENVLGTLRRQDMVLIQNVALNAFKGKVYGQSLRKNMTKLDLLYRNVGDGGKGVRVHRPRSPVEEPERHPQAAKMARVKQWVMSFVGSTARPTSVGLVEDRLRNTRANEKLEYVLPPDTQ